MPRRWVDIIRSECLADFKADLENMARQEDSLSKAGGNLKGFHYQRGLIDGIRRVLFQVTSREQEEKSHVRRTA